MLAGALGKEQRFGTRDTYCARSQAVLSPRCLSVIQHIPSHITRVLPSLLVFLKPLPSQQPSDELQAETPLPILSQAKQQTVLLLIYLLLHGHLTPLHRLPTFTSTANSLGLSSKRVIALPAFKKVTATMSNPESYACRSTHPTIPMADQELAQSHRASPQTLMTCSA